MKTKGLYKTAEQIEFAELFGQLNWKKADVAYALHVSRSAITMILQGKRNPRAATLEGLRELLKKQGEAKVIIERIEARTSEREELDRKLDLLQDRDPAGYQSAAAVINTLAGNIQDPRPHAEVDQTLNRIEEERVEKESKSSSKTREATLGFVGKRIQAIRGEREKSDQRTK